VVYIINYWQKHSRDSAADVVRLTFLLRKRDGINEVYGVARKEMAPALLYAAAFDPDIERVALIDSILISFNCTAPVL
jgi:hypothetical protein